MGCGYPAVVQGLAEHVAGFGSAPHCTTASSLLEHGAASNDSVQTGMSTAEPDNAVAQNTVLPNRLRANYANLDAGQVAYWEREAGSYDEDIIDTSQEDTHGVIASEMDVAVRRARRSAHGHGKPHHLLAVDVGCGPGKWLPAISDRYERVVGVDQSPGLLEVARQTRSEQMSSAHRSKVELADPTDLGRPCIGESGRGRCGPGIRGLDANADLVTSFNVLLSPGKKIRARILRRAAEMLRPTQSSTLLLLVPSAESAAAVRSLYRRMGGLKSDLGSYVDFNARPEEEASNVFRAHFVKTQHFTKAQLRDEVGESGLELERIRPVPLPWRLFFPDALASTLGKLRGDARPHLWLAVAHPPKSGVPPWPLATAAFL